MVQGGKVKRQKVRMSAGRYLPMMSRDSFNRDDAEAKKAEAARKKAEKQALLDAEERDERATPKGAGAKTAQKKSRGTLDLGQLDDSSSSSAALNATGIDNALDALSLTGGSAEKVDRHPERRFKAAYAAYETRRMPEIEDERPGLRKQQRVDLIRKEFEKSPENPFNQVTANFDSTRDELSQIREQEKDKAEARLTERR